MRDLATQIFWTENQFCITNDHEWDDYEWDDYEWDGYQWDTMLKTITSIPNERFRLIRRLRLDLGFELVRGRSWHR